MRSNSIEHIWFGREKLIDGSIGFAVHHGVARVVRMKWRIKSSANIAWQEELHGLDTKLL